MVSDNFDGEVKGTSPPANVTEDGTLVCDTIDVDDTKANSSPNSMRIISDGTLGIGRFEIVLGSTDNWSIYLYGDGNGSFYIMSVKNTGNVVYNNVQVWVVLTDALDIKWYNGAAYIDTGFNWTADAWKLLEIIPDYDNDEYEIKYDGVSCEATADFRVTGATAKAIHMGITGGATGYFDDFGWPTPPGSPFSLSPSKVGSLSGGIPI